MPRAPFSRYGGKYYMLKHLLPLLPPHDTFVEVFCGAAWLLLAKPPVRVEVINDLDAGIVNFYRVVRDPLLCAQLQDALDLTPYARAEFLACTATWRDCPDGVEKARRWYVMARQSVVGDLSNTGWSYDAHAQVTSRYRNAIAHLPAVCARLAHVQVDDRDFRDVLTFWNRPGVFIYCDPPYVRTTRSGGAGYTHEMTDADHDALVGRLLAFRGTVLLSGYDHPLYSPLTAAGWYRHDFGVVAHSTGSTRDSTTKLRRVESVWMNYDPHRACGQGVLQPEAS